MNSTRYAYDVRISYGADLFKDGPMAKALPNCGEMVISSKQFADYDVCEKSLAGLLTTLTRAEAVISKKNHVIVTKMNPLLDTSGKKHSDLDAWDMRTVLRAYIADADSLKQSVLKYFVVGQIKVDEHFIATNLSHKLN